MGINIRVERKEPDSPTTLIRRRELGPDEIQGSISPDLLDKAIESIGKAFPGSARIDLDIDVTVWWVV